MKIVDMTVDDLWFSYDGRLDLVKAERLGRRRRLKLRNALFKVWDDPAELSPKMQKLYWKLYSPVETHISIVQDLRMDLARSLDAELKANTRGRC